jgi:hypothetical protein
VGDHQPIEFDNVRVNVGHVYNTSHGMFTTPTAGLYAFSWTTVTHGLKYQYTELAVNGVFYAEQLADSRSNADGPGSNTVVADLIQGDEVWIRTSSAGADGTVNHGGLYGYHLCTFAGWLLHEH